MSIQYCPNCDKHIDLDKDVEHFERCKEKVKLPTVDGFDVMANLNGLVKEAKGLNKTKI